MLGLSWPGAAPTSSASRRLDAATARADDGTLGRDGRQPAPLPHWMARTVYPIGETSNRPDEQSSSLVDRRNDLQRRLREEKLRTIEVDYLVRGVFDGRPIESTWD